MNSRTRVSVSSILLTKIMCGIWCWSRKCSSGATVIARSITGSTTTTAASATISAFMVSWPNSIEPGQSRKVQLSPRNVVLAGVTCTLILRWRASGLESPTVLPSFAVPRRAIAPVTSSRLSSSVVLPER